METLVDRARGRLAEAAREGRLTPRRVLQGAPGPRVRIEGVGEVLIFNSSDYLGLANHPEVVAAAAEAIARYGAGQASARGICGTTALHVELEARLAAFVGKEASAVFSSTFFANLGLFPAITAPGDVVLSDALNHASIIDSLRLTPREVRRAIVPHGDIGAFDRALAEHRDAPARFIITDGIFSMEGRIAPLRELAALAERHRAVLIVDDAHAIGAIGHAGRGSGDHLGVADRINIVTGSLGKALGGAAGGFVAGPAPVIETLLQFARPSVFSTAIPASSAAASLKAIELMAARPQMVADLAARSARLRALFAERGLDALPGEGPIVPLLTGEGINALAVADRLLDRGILVSGFDFPVVPQGAARLRFQVSLAHAEGDLVEAADRTAEVLAALSPAARAGAAR